MKRVLTEFRTFNQINADIVLEDTTDKDGKKNLYLKGIFLEGDVRNHNRRVYPTKEIRRAVETLNGNIKAGQSILGEADHPKELNINLDRVSHMVTEMWMEDNKGMGKLKILPTPMGNIIRIMLENGVKLGVSSRGSGNVDSTGTVEDFEIVTVDIVAQPSAPNAYPTAVYEKRYGLPVSEAYNTKDGAVIEDLAIAMQYDPKAQKYLAEKIRTFLRSL